MRKIYSTIILALLAVTAFAGVKVPMATLVAGSPQQVLSIGQRPAKMAPGLSFGSNVRAVARAAEETVTPPENLEEQSFRMTGLNKYQANSGTIAEEEWESRTTVVIDGADVYIKGLAPYYMPESWVKGTLENNVLTIGDQLLGVHSEYGISIYLAGMNDLSDLTYEDLTFDYDAEAGTFTARNIVANYYPNGWLDAFADVVLTKMSADEIPQLVTVPETLETKELPLKGHSYYNNTMNDIESTVKVGFVGDDMYIQGLSSLIPSAWVKGTKQDDAYVFPSGQYLGTAGGSDLYLVGYENQDIADVRFTSSTEDLYILENIALENGAKNSVYFLRYYSPGLVIGVDEVPDLVVLPEETTPVEMPFEGTTLANGQSSDFAMTVKAVFDGDDLYLQGVCPYTDAWIKGTKDADNKVTFVSPQNFGTYGSYQFYMVGVDEETGKLEDVVFAYSPLMQTYELTNGLVVNGEKYSLYYYRWYAAGSILGTPREFTSLDFNSYPADFPVSTQNSHDGDITRDLTITTDEVTATVTPSTSSTANRFWKDNRKGVQLRVYGGSMTFEAPEGKLIEKLTFNNGKWAAANSVDVGELTTEGVWTGSANKVEVTIAGNTQINSIEVETTDEIHEYTITPAEGEVESIGAVTITFGEYEIAKADASAVAELKNTTTGEEDFSHIMVLASKKISLSFANISAAGDYTLTIPAGAVKRTDTDEALGELVFHYTIAEKPVELPEGVTAENWTLEGTYFVYSYSGWTSSEKQNRVKVAFNGNDIYVQGFAGYFPEAWLKGTVDGGVATFATGQLAGEDEYGKEYIVGSEDFESVCDIKFVYDAEAQTLTQQTAYILENAEGAEEVYPYSYWTNAYLYAGEPIVLDPVEAPADLATETYLFKALSYENGGDEEENSEELTFEDYTNQVQVGFDGDDVYIQGIAADVPELWVKATKNADGKYVIPANQYMGTYDVGGYGWWVYDYYFTAVDTETGALTDVVLTYDAETETFSTDQLLALNGAKNNLYYYLLFQEVTITKLEEFAATPADPEVVAFNSTSSYPNVQFEIPTVDVDGNQLLTSKLFYTVWIEKNGEEQPYTFTSALYSRDFEEDVTEVPYTHEGYDFYQGGSRVYFEDSADEIATWTKIGVQSIYTGGDAVNKSNIVWNDGSVTTGINDVQRLTTGAPRLFDLQGRQVENPSRGIYISDGKKVVLK